MSLLAAGLQPSVMPGLFSVHGALPNMRISDALINQGAAYDISFPSGSKSIMSDFRDPNLVSCIVAADINRLCTASLQSAIEAERSLADKFSAPWSLIKLYYAAFYAGHAIVRTLGGGCCWLETDHVAKINNGAIAIGLTPSFRIEPGNYGCEISPSGTAWTWKRLSAGKGTHETFWAYFEGRLRAATSAILQGPMPQLESQQAYAKLAEWLDLGVVRRSNHWLSRVRNEVQYQFGHGAWHPADLSQADRTTLTTWAAKWSADPLSMGLGTSSRLGEIGQFVAACTFLVALCRALVQRVAERNSRGTKHQARFSPEHFISLRAASP